MTESVSKQAVLFVGGMPRSGSTLLDLLAGQLPGHFDVGELFYMWQDGPKRNLLCACGEHFDECPFWIEVGKRAFGGWDGVDADQVIALQSRVDTTSRLPLASLGRLLPDHQRAISEYLEITTNVLRSVADVAGADVVVDSTKRPSTAFLLAGATGIDLRIAHVVRDPRGVVNSWSREVPLPKNAGVRDHLKKRSTRQTVRRYVTVNAMIETVGRRGTPIHRIRYEDLVSDPRAVMAALMGLWGLPVDDHTFDFLDSDHPSHQSHAISGGRVRMQSGPIRLRLDEAWRRELPAWKKAVTVGTTYPLMRRYGYS